MCRISTDTATDPGGGHANTFTVRRGRPGYNRLMAHTGGDDQDSGSGSSDAPSGKPSPSERFQDEPTLSLLEEALEEDALHEVEEVDPFPFLSARLPGQSKLEYLGRRAWAVVGIGVALWGILKIVERFEVILVPILLTAVIIVMCAPIVDFLASKGIHRAIGTLICYLVAGALIAGLVVLIIPAFTSQARLLAEEAPGYVDRSSRSLEKLQERLDDSSPQAGEALRQARLTLQNRIVDLSGEAVGAIFTVVQLIIGLFVALLISAVVSFMILIDIPRMKSAAGGWLDKPRNRRLAGALRAMQRSAAWYVRGQIITSLAVGILISFVYWLLGVPFYLPLGALSGVFHIIPGIGPLIAAVPAVLIALSSGGWFKALIVGVVTGVIVQAVAYLIAPKILGKVVELDPVTVIVALTVGGALFGLPGVLLAVPAVAAARDGIRWALYTPAEVEAAHAEGVAKFGSD